jgi:large subunit ribosomal protein L17
MAFIEFVKADDPGYKKTKKSAKGKKASAKTTEAAPAAEAPAAQA